MIQKSYWMLKAIMDFHRLTQAALESNVPLQRVTSMPVVPQIARMKEFPAQSAEADIQELMSRVRQDFSTMGVH